MSIKASSHPEDLSRGSQGALVVLHSEKVDKARSEELVESAVADEATAAPAQPPVEVPMVTPVQPREEEGTAAPARILTPAFG